jgi:hypothetical protein
MPSPALSREAGDEMSIESTLYFPLNVKTVSQQVVLQRLALIADHPGDDQIASHQAAILNSSAIKSA